jgi:uncharacterized protein YecE (DUF72 family)
MTEKLVLSRAERRARREIRRAKQRVTNIARAQKMHKARLAAAKQPKLPGAASPLDALAPPAINVGCSGWFYWHWRAIFYPQELPTKLWFRHYASRFNTVELNAPFYSWPTVATVGTWRRQAVQPGFVYTVKVSELITHVKRFRGTKQLIADFGFIADLLGPMMGCFLFQLPPSFHYTPARLRNILDQLEHRRRNVVEFRHSSWWNQEVFAAFQKTGTIFCSCSGPKLPDELIKTTDDVYIRFHGLHQWYRHNYSAAELAIWTDRIRKSGAKRVWAYFNNDREGHAIENATTFQHQNLALDSNATS